MTDRGRRDYLLQVPTRKLHLVLPVVRAVAVMNPLSRRNDRILHNRGGASGVDMLEEQNYCDAGFRFSGMRECCCVWDLPPCRIFLSAVGDPRRIRCKQTCPLKSKPIQ
ncbi:uncharacterized protein [Physcomitrium patens]|uniref:uncharacterized protein isoform X1 n=1 Tax=Physcomitrium patens TaxID=3218 RepID=UPI003CCD4D6F